MNKVSRLISGFVTKLSLKMYIYSYYMEVSQILRCCNHDQVITLSYKCQIHQSFAFVSFNKWVVKCAEIELN